MILRRQLNLAVVSVLAAAGLVAGSASPAAAIDLWTLTPLVAVMTAGVPSTIGFTASNTLGLDEVGCVELAIPQNFQVVSVVVTGTNSQGTWFADASGDKLRIMASGGGARLELLEWVSFDVTVVASPEEVGIHTWNSNAHTDHGCGGPNLLGEPPVTVTVLGDDPTSTPEPTPTPTPTATPTQTPSPTPKPSKTPKPTPTPTPVPLPSIPLPSLPLPSLPLPAPPISSATPTPSPAATTRAVTPTPEASESEQPGGLAGSGRGADGGSASIAELSVAAEPTGFGSLALTFGGIELALGSDAWSVPLAAVGVPGLLVILWVALQSFGAMMWIPAVRQMRGSRAAK